ncbi:MAG: DUF481 domain-containing protein [Gemmatimonadota bacterium]|nr:DUF481 domain-containing protein [Gemmatimonadota bacterium]MDH5761100.1 DUF481 domain-containing protein [Gemmatimonadota bacterium]
MRVRVLPYPTLIVAAAVATMTGPEALHAQAAPDTTDTWETHVELGFNGASGNSQFAILRTGGGARYLRTDQAQIEATAVFRYGRSDGNVIANDMRAQIKMDLQPGDAFSPFVFADMTRDQIRRLDLRASMGAGAQFRLWQNAAGGASFSAATLFDYQNITVDPTSTDPGSEGAARWSGRVRFDHKFPNGTSLKHQTHYQPVWDSPSDYLVEVTSGIATQVLGSVSLAVEHEFTRDSTPPTGILPNDQKFSVIFRMTL